MIDGMPKNSQKREEKIYKKKIYVITHTYNNMRTFASAIQLNLLTGFTGVGDDY
jgi:CRISPR/Cas system CMR-associated protein Cmr3 (group 5 of RAMP superfamily)